MPNVSAHHYFAKDVYKNLEPKLKRKIDRNTMITFASGPDVFQYQFLNPILHSRMETFSRLVHESNAKKFFLTYIERIIKYRLEKNKEALGSLYGYLTHYVLDKKTNPFIFYQTGYYDSSKPSTKKYQGKKEEMELLIDLYMLEKRERMKPAKIRIDEVAFPKVDFAKSTENLLNRVYQETYHVSNMGKYHLSSIRQMKWYYRHFAYDPHGLKLKCYNGISRKLPFLNLPTTSYASNLRSKVDYLNFEHHTWSHPLVKEETSSKSFFDLYQEAKEEAGRLITLVDQVFTGELDMKKLERKMSDDSYLTGKDWHIRKAMKYFRKEDKNERHLEKH